MTVVYSHVCAPVQWWVWGFLLGHALLYSFEAKSLNL